MLNPDYRDILSIFSEERVKYLVVGAYALAVHGNPRATGGIDLWVLASSKNAARITRAISRFGAPLDQVEEGDFEGPDLIFQIGVAPCRIDILTSISGIENFKQAWKERIDIEIEGITVHVLGRQHLIDNKRATGRPQDLADVAWLESRSTD